MRNRRVLSIAKASSLVLGMGSEIDDDAYLKRLEWRNELVRR